MEFLAGLIWCFVGGIVGFFAAALCYMAKREVGAEADKKEDAGVQRGASHG